MYIKLSLVDELFIIKNFDLQGAEISLPSNLEVKLYNKVSNTYRLFKTITETSTVESNLLTNPEAVYASIYINNQLMKQHTKVNVTYTEAVSTYALTYTSQYSQTLTSNTFLKRYTLSMPSWSSAFKNDISLYSKLISPLFLVPERIYYKTNEYLWSNLRGQTNQINPITFDSPLLFLKNNETGKYIPRTLIKQKEAINKVITTPLNYKNLKLFSYEHADDVFPITFGNSFNYVLLKSDVETVVILVGLNEFGEKVTESVYLNDVAQVTALSKYKKLISVTPKTTNAKITVSNYSDCLVDNTIRYPYEVAGTVTKYKNIDVPKYIYNDDTKCLNSYHKENVLISGDLEDSYRINDMYGYDKYFVTNQEDLIVLKDSKLYTGLLRKNIETKMIIHPSNNNNTLVSVLSEDSYFDNIVEFCISPKDIIQNYGHVSAQITLRSSTGVLYLNDNNDWISEPCYKFLNNLNPIYVEINVSEQEYVSIELLFNEVVYQSSVRKDDIPLIDQNTQIDDLLFDGLDLIGKIGNNYFKIELIKDYYEIINDKKISYSYYDKEVNSTSTIKGYRYG